MYSMNRGFLSGWGHPGALRRTGSRAFRNERLISSAAVGVVLISIAGFLYEAGTRLIEHAGSAEWGWIIEAIIGKSLVGFFLFSGLVFQLTRLGYLIRFSRPPARPDSETERVYTGHAPSLAILVPSYKEEALGLPGSLIHGRLRYPFRGRRSILRCRRPLSRRLRRT